MRKQEPVKVRFLQKLCRLNSQRADKFEKLYYELKASNEASKLNLGDVINSVCDCCVPRPEDPFEYDNPICEKCGLPIKQTDC